MSNYFVRNLETGKIELHFAKSVYMALTQEKKAAIKSAFLWSKFAGAWVSRSSRNNWRAESIAKDLGLEDHGEIGGRLSFAEQMEQKAERAEERADRMEERAERAGDEARQRFAVARRIGDCIPLGQPILVGHHSERGHRADLKRIDNSMRKGVEAYRKSQHYEARAEAARNTASQAQLGNTAYLERRIKENEKAERGLMNYVEQAIAKDKPDWLDRLHPLLEEVRDKLAFFRERLEAAGGVQYGKHNVKPGDFVLIRGCWQEVAKCNRLTVAVPNICFNDPQSQRRWALKYGWGEVKNHRPQNEEGA